MEEHSTEQKYVYKDCLVLVRQDKELKLVKSLNEIMVYVSSSQERMSN